MKPHELKPTIQRNGLASLYLIIGEEAYFRDSAVAVIRAAARSQVGSSEDSEADQDDEQFFNYDVLYGDETDALEVLACVQEVSFFAARRLVIITWAEKLPTREGEALIPYFENPTETTTLVVVGTKLDGRLKWVQKLKAKAQVVDCALPYENQRIGWVKQQADQLDVQLEEPALHMLKDLAGEGLYVTKRELEKLSTYLPASTRGTMQDVEAVLGMEPGASVFDLSDAMGAGDCGRALSIVAKNLEVGEAPLRILGALIWQVRRIWKAKDLLQTGTNQSQVAKQLGIPPFRAGEFFRQVRQWTSPQLNMAWELFWKADSALKGSASASPKRVLDALIIAVATAGKKQNSPRPQMRASSGVSYSGNLSRSV